MEEEESQEKETVDGNANLIPIKCLSKVILKQILNIVSSIIKA
jgi:hypothetical protein